MILEAKDEAAFAASPSGSYVAGASWAYFAIDEGLLGYAIWGAPSPEDIERLVRVLVAELARPLHDALVDFEHLDVVDPAAFELLATYARTYEKELARIVRRTAIVRPSRTVNAAIVSGFFDVASRPFPVTFASTVAGALEDLERSDARSIADALTAVRARVSREPELLRRVRALVAAQPAEADASEIARSLGLSARTLQRRLSELGTSFDAELKDVRLAAAEKLLRETDQPVTTIALDLGFKTAQHFATLFRSKTGMTPSELRARRRR